MLLGHLLATHDTTLGWHAQAGEVAYDAALIREAGIRSASATLTEGVTEHGRQVRMGAVVVPDFSGAVAGHAYIVRDLRVHVALTPGQTPAPTRQVVPRDDRRRAGWD